MKKFCLLRLLQNKKYPIRSESLRTLCKPGSLLQEQLEIIERLDPELIHFFNNFEKDLKNFETEFELINSKNMDIICYGEILYPSSFYFMKDPPLVLTMIGTPCWVGQPAISVVGSREPTEKSLLWIQSELGAFAQSQRVTWVSGGARGIDQAVHRMAVINQSPTVVVLPSGILQIYPGNLNDFKSEILSNHGCFISEYSPMQRVSKYLFHHRNRLIAALSMFTVIVEAKLKSGTLMTAHLALEDGRPVLVVPGHPTDIFFQGNLQLLFDGGQIVRTAQDLEELFRSEIRQSYHEKLLIDEFGKF